MLRQFLSLYILLIAAALIYILLSSTDKVEEWNAIDMTNDYIGAFHLIEELHQQLNPIDFQEIVNSYPGNANIPLEVVNINEVDLPVSINPGDVHIADLGESILYYRFLDSEQLARFGPMQTYAPLQEFTSVYDSAIFLLLAIVIFIWVWSLQRKLGRLELAAVQFGEGNFTSRVSEASRHKIGTLNHSFNLMAERIDNLIKGHKSLTNAVAHELRTPVARIRFQLDMMYEEHNEEQRKEFIYGISDDIEELGGLVDELLTFSRFDREQPGHDLQLHSLDDSLNNILTARKFDTDIDIKYDKGWLNHLAGVKNLPFEPKYLERAIGNLLTNAHKYANSKVLISVKCSIHTCTIIVDDDGPGIPMEDRENVFEPFKRLDNSRTRSTGGYGLGLAIVKQIAQWHAGKISVKDSPLGGARFSFCWPLHKEIEL